MITTLTSIASIENTAQDTQQNDLRSSSFRQSYHEISDQHVVETDVVEQLRANMAQLEDLHGRLRYMMGEISYLLKRS